MEKKENKNLEKNREKENFEFNNQFLKWNSNSCRYDSFFYLYICNQVLFIQRKNNNPESYTFINRKKLVIL